MKKLTNIITKWAVTGLMLIPLLAINTVQAQSEGTPYYPLEWFKIKFTEQFIEMPDPKARVTPHAMMSRAEGLRSVLLAIDPEMELTRFRPEFKAADTLRVNRTGKTIRRKDWSKVYVIRLSQKVDFFGILEQLEELESVEWVSPPVQIKTLAEPNDLHSEGTQWYIPKVQGTDAWDITKGDADIRLQILDDGIPGHDDIDDKLVTPIQSYAEFHGLWVAGVAGAETDNSDGIASLGWKTSIVDASKFEYLNHDEVEVVRFLEASFDDESDHYEDYHSDIVNCSFTTYTYINEDESKSKPWNYPDVEEAIEEALLNDIIIVAAAGNPPKPEWYVNEYQPLTVPYGTWPAAYDGVIAVSASNSNDNFPTGYNRGSFVDISAPSIDILTLDENDDYTTVDGTSFGSPLVAATVALMKDVNPSLTPAQAESILESTADKVGQFSYSGGWNQYMGHGRLNAYKAVKEALPSQYDDNLFATSTTLNSSHIDGYTDILSGVTLTVPQDKVVVLEGDVLGGGTNVFMEVYGKLIIDYDTDISRVHLDIKDGGELIIKPGAEIKMSTGASNNVNVNPGGKITAHGTQANPIKFTRYSGGTAWGKIGLRSSEGNSFKWVVFDGGNYTVEIQSKNNTFEHCTFKNGSRGISGWQNQDGTGNSSATLKYCLIEDNTLGIVSQYTNLDINYTTIQDNTLAGLYINSSNVQTFHHNLVTGNGGSTRDGIEVKSSGSLWMHKAYSEDGYNEVYNNGEDQISTSGDLLVGTFPYPGTQNAIYGNCSGSKYLIENNSGVFIDAYNAYWNCTSGSSMFNGLVDDGNHLGSNPTSSVPHGYGGQAPKAVSAPFDFNEAYEDALTRLNQAEDIQEIRNQLYKLYQVAGLSKDEALKDQFNTLVASAAQGTEVIYASSTLNTAFQQIASIFYSKSLIRDERFGQASTFLDERNVEELSGYDRRDYYHLKAVTETYHGEYEMALSTLENLYTFQGTQEVDMEEFRAGYSTFEEDIRAQMEEGDSQDQRSNEPAGSEQESEQLSLQNYPNPFNPVTNIRFAMPERGQVSLVVYDMLGREVATLVNNILPAGDQTVRFDASNLANGVYLYKLRAGSQEIIRKMTLIK